MNIRSIKLFIDRRFPLLAVVLLAFHVGMSWDAARKLSPGWDEIVYPLAGLRLWSTGTIQANPEHPPLGKLLIAAPVALSRVRIPEGVRSSSGEGQYRDGFLFTYRNAVKAQTILLLGRVSNILLSAGTGLLLFLAVSRMLTPAAGLMSLAVYVLTPMILSRSSLGLLEMPALFFLTAPLLVFTKEGRHGWREWLLSGTAVGASLACKMSMALAAVGMALGYLFSRPKEERWRAVVLGGGVALAVWLGAHLIWRDGVASLQQGLQNVFRVRDAQFPFFWNGRTWEGAPSFISYGVLWVKSSPFLFLLGLGGAVGWMRGDLGRRGMGRILLWSGGATLFMPFLVRSPISSGQMAFLAVALAGLAGGLAQVWNVRWVRAVSMVLGLAALVDVIQAHPNHLAYISPLAGGPREGYRWVGDSDQDWGQALPGLARWMEKEKGSGLLLSYSGPADPQAHGVAYQDVFSPALVSRESKPTLIPEDAARIYLAVGSKVLQTQPVIFEWVRSHLTPVAVIQGCFFIYEVTDRPDAFGWLAEVYQLTGRPRHVEWARRRVEQFGPRPFQGPG